MVKLSVYPSQRHKDTRAVRGVSHLFLNWLLIYRIDPATQEINHSLLFLPRTNTNHTNNEKLSKRKFVVFVWFVVEYSSFLPNRPRSAGEGSCVAVKVRGWIARR